MKKSIANGDDPAEIFGALQEYAEANKEKQHKKRMPGGLKFSWQFFFSKNKVRYPYE